MKLNKTGLSALLLSALAVPAIAGIHAKASSTSHELEEAAVELHDYMHDNYTTSYGAHGLEIAADTLHGTLHDYGNGTATEADVDADVAAMNVALQAVRANFRANGVWNDKGAKKLYDECHKLAARVTAYTN